MNDWLEEIETRAEKATLDNEAACHAFRANARGDVRLLVMRYRALEAETAELREELTYFRRLEARLRAKLDEYEPPKATEGTSHAG